MNNYRYPLVAGGAMLMLLSAQSARALPALSYQTKPAPLTAEVQIALDLEQAIPVELSLRSSSGTASQHAHSTDLDPSLTFEESETDSSVLSEVDLSSEVAQTPTLPGPPASPVVPPPTAAPSGDVLVPQPEIIIRSNGTSTPEILQPTLPAAPVLPRAVAPPVGDMAISNINAASDGVDLGTSAIVPRLVLRQAPAREVLAVLARYAGMNLVFTDTPGAAPAGGQPQAAAEPTVSLDLENEPVGQVFNSVLMISGLQANRRGRTIFVGSQLPQAARNLVSRTLRLNQIRSFNAGTFLASQGAEFQRLVTLTEDITDPLTGRVIGRRELPAQLQPIIAQRIEGSTSALMLAGLAVTADDRLNSITLVGEPRQVQVATSLLTQLDARRRQVAINVKIVDVNLNNQQDFNSSFSFGVNDSFFVQDNGAAVLNFGRLNPPNRAQTTGGAFAPPIIPLADTIVGNSAATFSSFFDVQPNSPFGQISRFLQGQNDFFGNQTAPYSRPNFGTFNNPFQPGVSDFDPVNNEFTYEPPSLFEFPQKFLLTLETTIQSGNAKILTDPTLVVQEGQQATVKLTQKVIESVNTSVDPLSGVRTTTPVLADAGLTLTINVEKVDDNGFINITVSPTIAAPGDTEQFDSGAGTINTLTLLSRRELTSGLIRLRDGQTLILSGIIQETDQTITQKVPILGDIPILGALFRSQSDSTERTEVIILVTPQIMQDNPTSQFGVNYTPGGEAAEVLREQGFPVQVVP